MLSNRFGTVFIQVVYVVDSSLGFITGEAACPSNRRVYWFYIQWTMTRLTLYLIEFINKAIQYSLKILDIKSPSKFLKIFQRHISDDLFDHTRWCWPFSWNSDKLRWFAGVGEAYTGRANNRGRSFEGRGEGPKRINQLPLFRLLHGDQTRNTL